MKKLQYWIALASLVPALALAQEEDTAATRARITAERSRLDAAYRAQEKECYRKFAVNDCLKAARAQRREALADLNRQETSLNDAERKRKGAERQRELEEKAAAEKNPPSGRQPDQKGGSQRPAPTPRPDTAQKEAEHARTQATNAANAQERKREAQLKAEEKKAEQARRLDEAARNVKRQQETQAQAEEHRAAVNNRLAERKKPPAPPLPEPN